MYNKRKSQKLYILKLLRRIYEILVIAVIK